MIRSLRPPFLACFALLLLLPVAPVAAQSVSLSLLGRFETGIFDDGAAEIVAYDAATQRLFFVNAASAEVVVLDVSDPANPAELFTIDAAPYGDGANTVAVAGGLVAVAVEADPATDPGQVVFFDTDGTFLQTVPVGALPDGVAFTPGGAKVIVANEGEPNDEYTVDPEGSISIIDVSGTPGSFSATTIGFADFNAGGSRAAALPAGVRIFGPGASVAQDLEPEYVAVSPDGAKAYVTLQENNAVAIVDVAGASVDAIVALGTKDHSLAANPLDASNRDDAINIQTWPVQGFYHPDAIAAYEAGGQTYLVTANEGDARDYDGFSEEERVSDLTLDPFAFPDAATLQLDGNLGRLRITSANGFTERTVLAAELEGDQEVPPVDTDAEGSATLAFGDGGTTLRYSIVISGLDFGALLDGTPRTAATDDDVAGLHLHGADRGANGGVVFGIIGPDQDDDRQLTENADGSVTITGLWEAGEGSANPADFFVAAEAAANGDDLALYLNVHTPAHPGGESRGQLVKTEAYSELYSYGGRSFSIWDASGALVYDSEDDFEQITAAELPDNFNSNNDENGSFDSRSDDKGPEPEGVTLGVVDGRTYAFIGLERVGGVMVYDVTDPAAPTFVDYTTSRDFSGDAEGGTAGDLGPEGLVFIDAADSPTGQPLLVVSHEVSGSVAIYSVLGPGVCANASTGPSWDGTVAERDGMTFLPFEAPAGLARLEFYNTTNLVVAGLFDAGFSALTSFERDGAGTFTYVGADGEEPAFVYVKVEAEDAGSSSRFFVRATDTCPRTVDLDPEVALGGEAVAALAFALDGNAPNPLGATTTIRYALAQAEHVRLAVYDALGRQVALLVDTPQNAGQHEALFDASALPSGMYFYRLQAGTFTAAGRMTVVK